MESTGNDLEKLSKQDLLKIMKSQGENIDRLRYEVGALRQELGLDEEKKEKGIPETDEIQRSYDRMSDKNRIMRFVGILTVVAAVTAIIQLYLLPVLRI